jgi:hypothetical protein
MLSSMFIDGTTCTWSATYRRNGWTPIPVCSQSRNVGSNAHTNSTPNTNRPTNLTCEPPEVLYRILLSWKDVEHAEEDRSGAPRSSGASDG